MKKLLYTLASILLVWTGANAQTITTIAGNGTIGYFGDGGPASSALMNRPNQLCFDLAGNLYIAEDYNNLIRKIDVLGNISTVAGTGVAGFSGDGGLATSAQIDRACGVAVDAAGNLYICDAHNYRIRKVNTSGIISTIVGTGVAGYNGDGLAATLAEIGFTSGVCVDASGNIYIASQNNGPAVRKINAAGIISTYAGTGVSGFSGDGGPAASAQLNAPASVYLDPTGNLYIGDLNGMRVRKVNTSGNISTFAGNGSAASGGDGMAATSAQLFYPYGVTGDAAGSIYICESGNNKIRKVNSSGIMSTFAGVGGIIGGYGGDGGPAISAQLYHPSAITVDVSGNVFVGDYENNAIRKIVPAGVGINEADANVNFSVYPNPGTDLINISLNSYQNNFSIKVLSLTSQLLMQKNGLSGSSYSLDISGFAEGIYFLEISSAEGFSRMKVVKSSL